MSRKRINPRSVKPEELKNSLPRPWKAVMMMRIRRTDVVDMDDGTVVAGYLVDHEGTPLNAPEPWVPVYLRGLGKKAHPKWDVATMVATGVIYREDGWEIILASGDRIVLKELDNGGN